MKKNIRVYITLERNVILCAWASSEENKSDIEHSSHLTFFALFVASNTVADPGLC